MFLTNYEFCLRVLKVVVHEGLGSAWWREQLRKHLVNVYVFPEDSPKYWYLSQALSEWDNIFAFTPTTYPDKQIRIRVSLQFFNSTLC